MRKRFMVLTLVVLTVLLVAASSAVATPAHSKSVFKERFMYPTQGGWRGMHLYTGTSSGDHYDVIIFKKTNGEFGVYEVHPHPAGGTTYRKLGKGHAYVTKTRVAFTLSKSAGKRAQKAMKYLRKSKRFYYRWAAPDPSVYMGVGDVWLYKTKAAYRDERAYKHLPLTFED